MIAVLLALAARGAECTPPSGAGVVASSGHMTEWIARWNPGPDAQAALRALIEAHDTADACPGRLALSDPARLIVVERHVAQARDAQGTVLDPWREVLIGTFVVDTRDGSGGALFVDAFSTTPSFGTRPARITRDERRATGPDGESASLHLVVEADDGATRIELDSRYAASERLDRLSFPEPACWTAQPREDLFLLRSRLDGTAASLLVLDADGWRYPNPGTLTARHADPARPERPGQRPGPALRHAVVLGGPDGARSALHAVNGRSGRGALVAQHVPLSEHDGENP